MEWDILKLANLGGVCLVVFYLLKYTIPNIIKSHKDEVILIQAQHATADTAKETTFLRTMELVLAESKRANDSICARMERMEQMQASQTKTLAAIVDHLQGKDSPVTLDRSERESKISSTADPMVCAGGSVYPSSTSGVAFHALPFIPASASGPDAAGEVVHGPE